MPESAVRDPVFVICHARSGSTLLRFLLDTHPELACPPETNLPALCAQLATVWSLIEGAPLSANRGDEPPEIPDAAIRGIRDTMDVMIGSYLDRRKKQRYCDKSLGTARFSELLLRVYPQARFICLYRHPMDVIASGLEACPFGLQGFGFDPYIAETPGNAVLALARYWADNAAVVQEIEARYPEHCHRVRYEDLVADPERTAAEIFSFLGAAPAPGVSTACFSSDRERYGPGDYKIWRTSRITDASVGRGWSIPAQMIPPDELEQVNEMVGELGYLPIDDGWGASAPPGDLRAGPRGRGAYAADGVAPHAPTELTERLQTGLTSLRADVKSAWGQHASERFLAVVVTSRTEGAEYWLVDLEAGRVSPADREARDKSDWDIVGTADTWEKVLAHDLNLNVALRSSRLRYCDETGTGAVAMDTRLRILSCLLGMAAW